MNWIHVVIHLHQYQKWPTQFGLIGSLLFTTLFEAFFFVEFNTTLPPLVDCKSTTKL
jgi:hypothetical protein